MLNLRLAHICRRRMLCLLAMDRRGTVTVVEEASRRGEVVIVFCGGVFLDCLIYQKSILSVLSSQSWPICFLLIFKYYRLAIRMLIGDLIFFV